MNRVESAQVRRVSRAVLMDRDACVLLFRFTPAPPATPYWALPGGGLETGESARDALRRELAEELQLDHCEIGRCLWLRNHHVWRGENWQLWREVHYLVECERFDSPTGRWWSIDDLARTSERFGPPQLPELLQRLADGQLPRRPLMIVQPRPA
jgi:ADP-ribose pyrophosphatase YjhB (NUDIX family)